jgi:hypothetical protein
LYSIWGPHTRDNVAGRLRLRAGPLCYTGASCEGKLPKPPQLINISLRDRSVKLLSRFVDATSFQAIKGGNRPIGAIDAPDIGLHPSDPSSVTQPASSLVGSRHSHAARVVGSFDHSILPEPPVCFSRNSSAIELTSLPLNGSEKDNDTRYGFFIMLCYRRE